jgi:GrpB-like predicted nucleotidyltransferase (UPF0157 family)/GNAT superfamily N-acetyltransferase
MGAFELHIRFDAADPLGNESAQLLRQMRAEALCRYGDNLDPFAPITNEPLVGRSAFLIARLQGSPVGCAGLRPLDAKAAEVKRMYVIPTARRRGIGRRLLAELEAKAALFGFTTLRLETGNRQPEAIALYESSGFRRIAPYGSHVDAPLSICFEKAVVGAPNQADIKGRGPGPVRTEEYLAAVTIGERKPLNSTIHLAPYDPRWPSKFARIANRIRAALGDKALLLEHVGSTSVPGLCAKPVIDVLLAVADSADESCYVAPLEQAGFVLRVREPDWFEHRLFKTPDADGNLHVFSHGSEEIGRMLAFRDWLRMHEEARRRYEVTKRALAARTWRHVQDYADAKSEIVQEILAHALSHQDDWTAA